MNDPYHYRQPPGQHGKKRKRRKLVRLVVLFFLISAAVVAYIILKNLKPETSISQSVGVTRKAEIKIETNHFEQDGFSIDLPKGFQAVDPGSSTYRIHSWLRNEKGTNGEQLYIYKDTIPANYAVNRVLIVRGQSSQLEVIGGVSDNCSTFTKGMSAVDGGVAVPAKWQDISFLCDQFNRERDVIGISSTNGINTVILTSPSTGRQHKFFFAYSNHDITPDYTTFINALNSFKLQ